MRNRACPGSNLGATECNQRICGPGCQASGTVHRSAAAAAPDYHNNGARPLCETNSRNHRIHGQGRNLHHPSCNCGNCSRGRYRPERTFKDLLYRQVEDAGEGATRSHSLQSHAHSQQNGYDHRCCRGGPSFYQGKRPADSFIDRSPSTPRSSVFSGSGDVEQRNASPSAGFMSRVPFLTKTSEFNNSPFETASKRNFSYSEKAAPAPSKEQICLYGWCLMKPSRGDNTSGSLPCPGVAICGYKSPLMLQAELIQTARVEQRLERWRVRTCDGVEVSLMGMIDVKKSIANEFSPALVKYFLLGFPSTWIYMIKSNLNIRGSIPVSPSSAHESIDNFAGEKSQDVAVESNSVLGAPAPLFTPPSEGTWREALRSFSPTTVNFMHAESSDVNTTQESDLNRAPSEVQRSCPKVHPDPQAKNSCLQRKTSSLMADCPNPEPEDVGVDNADKVSDDSSETGKATLFRPRRPGLQVDMAAEAGGDPEGALDQVSEEVMDLADLAPVISLGEDVNEVFRCSSQAQELRVVSDSPDCVEKVNAIFDGARNATTEEGIGAVDDLIVYSEDFAEDPGDEPEIPSVQVPLTSLETSRQPMDHLNKQTTDNSTPRVGIDPVKCPKNLDTGRKLRSGRYIVIVEKKIREQVIVEDAVENSKSWKKAKNPEKLSSEGREEGMHSKRASSTKDHEDAGEPGGLDQAPSTPSLKFAGVKRSTRRTLLTPTTNEETGPENKLHIDHTKKLRSGRRLRAFDVAVQESVLSAVINLDSLKSGKRRRISPSAAPVAECADYDSIECEGTTSNATMEEQDAKVAEQETEDDRLLDHEGVVSSRHIGQLCKRSAGINGTINKKRRRTVSKLYKSRRKTSCPESILTTEPKVESSLSDSCKKKTLKVCIDKALLKEETKLIPRKNSTKVNQSAKTTGRVELNCATSRSTSQAEKGSQAGKRNSIVPPPLPAPRVADASKVIEAYGLKKSRFGRIIVPPLAIWCNQSILYDMDGSIIAISDGSILEAESSTGCSSYTFPSDTGARKMQKNLLKAARIDWSKR